MDEATSALDAECEHLVQQAIDELIKLGLSTVIVIAHRLSTIRSADKIIVMHKGEIVQEGDHHTLVSQKDGKYAKLFERQMAALKQ